MIPFPRPSARLALSLAACLLAAGTLVRAAPARPATEVGGEVAPGTVWSLAGSPYETTSTVVVPVSVTLTIEPGVVVRLGPSHELRVDGLLEAVGTAESPIRFEASTEGLNWGTVSLRAGSGPSEIAHAVFTDGGSRRRALLGIAADAALVRDSVFTRSQGIGIEIEDGASPTIRGCRLDQVTDGSANPPAALRVLGPSDALIEDNFFQSNFQAVNWEADASPTFTGNRFDYNGLNGVVVTGTASRAVSWPNLGPREWSFFLMGSGVTIAPEGRLDIEPGTTVRMFTGAGIRVEGTLRASGTAVAKILFTTQSAEPKPGQWQEISFQEASVDYDPETGEGSVIDHAVIEYGGSSTGRSVFIRDSSPRIANTVVRESGSRGIVVSGADARPTLTGLLVTECAAEGEGTGLQVNTGAAPEVRFSIFRTNYQGLRTESGAQGRYGPHNRFDRNATFGAFNNDRETCIDASGNDWGSSTGPQDLSSAPDACGLGANMGDGDLVSDNVNYLPFEGQLPIPFIESPRCGSTTDRRPTIAGLAPPLSEIVVYDNHEEIGRTTSDEGEEGIAHFRFTPDELAAGSHVFQVQTAAADEASAISDPLELYVDPELWVDPAHITVSYDLDGTHFVQPYFHFVGERACLALRDDHGWQVRPHPGAPLTLTARLACPAGAPAGTVEYLGRSHPMAETDPGLHAATFDMGPGGTFDVRVTCGGAEKVFQLGTINIEYEGLVYDAAKGILVRVKDAKVTLLRRDPAINNYVQWRAEEFFGQTNPQITGPAGWYGFYPPPGVYRVQVDAEGYNRYISTDVEVVEEPVMLTIGLQPKGDKLFLPVAKRRL